MSIGTAAADYQAGRITFGQFARRVDPDFRRCARYLMRKWKAPSWVDPEDLQQEMLIACVWAVERWRPELATLEAYVRFNALDKAKKWLHVQRRAGHDGDKGRSRIEQPFSSLLTHDGEPREIEEISGQTVPPEQEDRLTSERALRLGDDGIASLILGSQNVREIWGVRTFEQARVLAWEIGTLLEESTLAGRDVLTRARAA